MQKALRSLLTSEHSQNSAPQITVRPGEIFEAETELCTGDWLKSADTVWSREKQKGVNPAVVIAIDGANAGDSILVNIHEITPCALGYTGFVNKDHSLANKIIDRDWGHNIKIVKIEDGFVHFSPALKLPVSPMIGVLGTAPAGDPIINSRGGRHGGNMDAQALRAGAAVTLPVECPGALLHIGDVHAIQGDGEICGSGGIECAALVRLSVDIIKRPVRNGCVRVENAEEICAIACEGDMENCCVTATRELIYWMCDGYGMEEPEAYLLLGQVMKMSVTQLVNPTRTILASVPKKYLPRV